jgi:hypothetical protein
MEKAMTGRWHDSLCPGQGSRFRDGDALGGEGETCYRKKGVSGKWMETDLVMVVVGELHEEFYT